MQPKLLKCIFDIESVLEQIEFIKQIAKNDFQNFSDDIIFQRAIEIVGEAVRKTMEINPTLQITASKNIIGIRNIISHAYDWVEPEMLWGIIQKNIPVLADEIRKIKGA